MFPRLTLSLLGTLLTLSPAPAATDIEANHHLFNLSPASATNPVVARVAGCDIEITAGEFRGFVAAEGPLEEKPRALNLSEKRELLERLVEEHLLLWNAYQQKWDQTEGIDRMVNDTRNMMLLETLAQKEVVEKIKKPEDYQRLSRQLRDDCFDKLQIIVSNESYEELKRLAKDLKTPAEAQKLPADLLNRSLATCELTTISVGTFLQAYTRLPAGQQPDLSRQESVIGILKELLGEPAMLAEARKRGFHTTREFREGLQVNRNILTRFYAQDRITDKATARLRSPEGQRALREWYESHLKDRYTVKDAAGKEQIVQFEAERESIANDYFDVLREKVRAEEARALRQGRKVEIDDEALEKLSIALSSSKPKDDR